MEKSKKISLSRQRGFTLIELMVVVIIVALLIAIIIASLSAAKNKAIDKAIQTNMLTIRTQAQLYFDGAGAGVFGPVQSIPLSNDCSIGLYGADSVIAQAVTKLKSDRGVNYVACFSTPSTFAIVTKFKFSNDYFCLDSSNTGKVVDANSNAAWNGMYGPGAQTTPATKTAVVDSNTALCNG